MKPTLDSAGIEQIASEAGCVELMVDRHVRSGAGARCALLEVMLDSGTGPKRNRALCYRSLMTLTMAIAARLPAVGIGAAPLRIVLIGSATLETVCHWLGAMRAGHQVFLVHPDLPAAQYDTLLQGYGPHRVWRDRTARVPLGELLPELQADDGNDVQPGQRAAAVSDLADQRFLDDVRPALVLASSGSTGSPKLCVHAHRAFWHFECNVSRPMWQLSAADRVLASGGPYFSFGLQGIHPPLSVGATAVLLPAWRSHTDFLDTIAAERVTVFLGVPTLFHLLQSRSGPERLARDTLSLRLCLSAGERLPEIVRQRWETHTAVPLCDSIGTTETFAPYFSEIAGQGRGFRPVPGFDYEMRRTDLADPEGSAIFVASLRSRCMMLGTLEQGALVPLARRFVTNDLFILKNGVWTFVSRRSERVKVSGYWASPQELEEFLLQDGRVLKVAAVAIETPEGLQRLRAFVVLKPEAGAPEAVAADLLGKAREQLRPKALCPDLVCPVPDLSSTPTGKLKRDEVRQQVMAMQFAVGAAELAQ